MVLKFSDLNSWKLMYGEHNVRSAIAYNQTSDLKILQCTPAAYSTPVF